VARHVEDWSPLALGIALALPVLLFRYPPMGDLAFHESLVAILRHFGDPRYFPAGLYELRLGQPNQLCHALAWALSLALPTDWACKVVVAASIVVAPLATARLASHFGRTRWAALLVLPVMLGWMFRWGLLPNMVGLAVWLLALPALDRFAKDPTPRRALITVALTFVVYLGHESTMGLYAVASVVFALPTLAVIAHPAVILSEAKEPTVKSRAARLALLACPGAFATLLAVLFAVRSESMKAPSLRSVASLTMPLLDKLASLPATLYSAGEASLPLLVATLLAVVGLGVRGWPLGLRRVEPRLAAVAAVAFVLYLAMPLTLGGSTLIHQRFLAPAFALFVVATVPAADVSLPRWSPLLAAFPLAMLAWVLPGFAEQDRVYRDLDGVLAEMADASAVAQLDLTPHAPSVVAPVVGAAARALAVHGGRLLFSFTDAPYTPVAIAKGEEWNEPVLRLANTPFAFMPEHDFRYFRYALVYLTEPKLAPALVSSFSPEGHLVTLKGSWMLFESNLPLVPLTAPDGALPSPAPETLAARVTSPRPPSRPPP
jgi:hypothetical protein